MDNTEQEARFKDYVWRYALSYFFAMAAAMLFSIFIYDLPSTLMNIAITYIAIMTVSNKFTKKHQRHFTKSEKKKFSIHSTITACLVSSAVALPVLALLFHMQPNDEMVQALEGLSAPLWLGIVLFVILMYYVIHIWGYGFANKQYLEQIEKQKAKAEAET